jgi:hypothetical protein
MKYLPVLIRILEGMNRDFGQGQVTAISFDMRDSDENGIYGQVERDGQDTRFFRFENDNVTFLSRKRKFIP